MSRMYKLEITPVGKPRMTQRDKWKVRAPVLRYRNYCDALRLNMPGYELTEELILSFYIPMPASWSKKKKAEMYGKPHDQKPDIDNLAKGFMDAFKSEDKHVYRLNCVKWWAYEGMLTVVS